MKQRPLISIGISTYNRADSYFPNALDSALAQTYPNLEIIVSDNCSSDGTSEVVRKRADSRLRYFRHEVNIGPDANFNFCLEQARGEYFLLLHDDDSIDPGLIEACVTALEHSGKQSVGIIRSGTRVVDGVGRVRSSNSNDCGGLSAKELFLKWFDQGTAFYLCSTLYNTEKLKQHGGFNSPEGLFQDVVALAELALRYDRVDVEEVLANFRRHDENKGSGASAMGWANDSLYLLDRLCQLLPEHQAELRRAGLPYLCRKCYRNAGAIPSPVQRWQAYLRIYRRFERTYSPVVFEAQRLAKNSKGGLRRLLVGQGGQFKIREVLTRDG